MGFFYWLGTLFGLTGGVWGLFSLFESCASKDTKTTVSRWIRYNLPLQAAEIWSSTFVSAFDGLFGTRFLSLRFGLVSILLSILCAVFLFMVWGMLRPTEIELLFLTDTIGVLVLIGVIFIFTNVLTDYLSNCQTRYVLGRLITPLTTNAQKSTFYTYSKWLIADLVLTLSLSAGVVLLISEITKSNLIAGFINTCLDSSYRSESINISTPFEVDKLISLHVSEIRSECNSMDSKASLQFYTPPFGVYFYTTVLTSAWLWLYALSGSFLSMVSRVLGPNAIVFRKFDFDEHPLSSLGGVIAVFLGSTFTVVSAIYFFL